MMIPSCASSGALGTHALVEQEQICCDRPAALRGAGAPGKVPLSPRSWHTGPGLEKGGDGAGWEEILFIKLSV